MRPFQAYRSVVLLLLLLIPAGVGATDSGTDATPPPRAASSQPTIAVWESDRVDVDRLVAEDEANRENPAVPHRIGTALEAGLTPANSGTWHQENGRWVWRVLLRSAGAHWLLPSFDRVRLEPGAELWLYGPGSPTRRGPYTRDQVVDGRLGLPPIDGESVVVEIDWPAEVSTAKLDFHLGRVFHGYRPWNSSAVAQDACADQAGACNVDVNCPLGDAWQDEKRGVLEIIIPDLPPSSDVAVCSGSLINNTALDCTPYVLTADHCFTPDSDLVATVFVFDYERPACGPGSASSAQFGTNALLRARHPATDFRLLEVGLSLPTEGLYFNGWSRLSVPPARSYSIHHPMGAPKKISYTNLPLQAGDGDPYPADYWRVLRWYAGVMEPGSSGAPLFDSVGRIIGQLDNGSSACDGAQPNTGGDNFGRLDVSWETHPTIPALRLKDRLDPNGSDVLVLSGMDQSFCGAPDSRLVVAGFTIGSCEPRELNPGETTALPVALTNVGPLPGLPVEGATTIAGTLSTQDPQVQLLDDRAEWPPINSLATAWSLPPHFALSVDLDRICGQSIEFEVDADSELSTFRVSTGSIVGQVSPFEDEMETGPGDWTVVPAGSWSLTTGNSAPGGGVTSWFVPNVGTLSDSRLVMPAYDSLPVLGELAAFSGLPPGLELRFEHELDSECGADGGVLEYSIDGSSWQDAGPRITEGGYNSEILPESGAALAGRDGWSGDLDGWRLVRVDFSDLEGADDLRLRWRFATNGSGGGVGWYVDNVVLEAPLFECAAPSCYDADCDGACRPPEGADCDDTNDEIFPGATEICNARDDDCDLLVDEDVLGEETDGDGVHNLCDNCVGTPNPSQADWNDDDEGDHCDLDDGLIYISFDATDSVGWQEEIGYLSWNAYRGDLDLLRSAGVYTQAPGSNELADRACALMSPSWQVVDAPDPGEAAFFLTTGVDDQGTESGLGANSLGVQRPNTNPCP